MIPNSGSVQINEIPQQINEETENDILIRNEGQEQINIINNIFNE